MTFDHVCVFQFVAFVGVPHWDQIERIINIGIFDRKD